MPLLLPNSFQLSLLQPTLPAAIKLKHTHAGRGSDNKQFIVRLLLAHAKKCLRKIKVTQPHSRDGGCRGHNYSVPCARQQRVLPRA